MPSTKRKIEENTIMGMRKFKRGLKGNQAIDLLLEMEREKTFGKGGIMYAKNAEV